MMSIGTALNAATTLVGATLPAALIGERTPVRTTRDDGTEEVPEAPPEGALLVAIEAGLREAGYLPA
ncbi:hypothetical protein [Methylobacterium frigidaeris]|uniref:Uncharacterized protein n=1 Tax=Methylobacterium frigidaeris TaxID=2038277 RepID=A0AA37M366_9HYPH|nr:hypothetical protein [Methylobacterium frigidaeris]PIK74366.1 hypothetical protein CS379_02945 [Methylobacterium frigidaeris]GJD61238.1 hypothetical protein MPEAHAMD_1378 [Methylobacterium frigidaeris]